jgi:uncharacterized iron-regulated protein
MFVGFSMALLVGSQTPTDPDNLEIGRPGTVIVQPGQLVDLRNGKSADLTKLCEAARGKPFVFLGEQHATAPHQQEEADIVSALVKSGRKVAVGFEMYTRVKQDSLDLWSAGKLSEADFLEQSEWKKQWGYDYSFYRPVFEAVRTNGLPAIALNVPRAWVHTVATTGFETLPTSARLQLPQGLGLDNANHRKVFDSLMGGHSMAGGGMDGMYAAQVLWDESMADTAIKFQELRKPDPNNLIVVIAGSGHVMYGQGINYRIKKHRHEDGITVVMISSSSPVKVSRGLADFVFVSNAPPEPAKS